MLVNVQAQILHRTYAFAHKIHIKMLVNVQAQIVHPFGIFLATLKNSGKIPTFCRNVGILPEHKKYAGSDLLGLSRRSEPAYFLCTGKMPTFRRIL